MADSRKHRTVCLNAARIAQLMRDRGWSVERLAEEAEISPGTVSAVLNGDHEVYWATAEKLRVALNVASLDELIRKSDKDHSAAKTIHEWTQSTVLSKWITASNQLQFRIWRLDHQHLKKSARGKCYDLQGMAESERQRARASLLRHAEVCSRIGEHPHIIRNISTFESPTHDSWWVIDDWVDGTPLAEMLRQRQPISPDRVWPLARQIASALQTLHTVGIIRRELSPQSVLIANDIAILTEFELAKLLDGSPTVSNDEWPVDPYRAPEVGSDDVDVRVDIYSWARLTLHLLLGELPAVGQEISSLRTVSLPKPLGTLLQQSLAISRRSRPSRMDDVLAVLPEPL